MKRRRNGMATLLALVTVALLGLTTLALSAGFINDAKRTRRLLHEAQAQQLLLAGCDIAQHRLAAGDDVEAPVVMPGDLADPQARLTLSEVEPGVIDIVVALNSQRAGQRVTFVKADAGWQLRDAQLLSTDELPTINAPHQ